MLRAKIDAVKVTAKGLMKTRSTVTAKEMVIALKAAYSDYYWDQQIVADIMADIREEESKLSSTPKRGRGRPKKNVASPVTPESKPETISKAQAIALVEQAGGKYFTATFIKKNGDERVMNCQAMPDATSSKLGYVRVKVPGKLKAGEPAIRNVNMQTLKALKIKGKTYKVR